MRVPDQLGNRKHTEEKSQLPDNGDWKERYDLLLESLSLALIEIDHQKLTFINESALQYLELKNFPEKNLESLFLEEDPLWKECRYFTRTLASSGNKISFTPIREFEPGNCILKIDILRDPKPYDIQDPVNELYSKLVEQSSDGICLINQDGLILEWNDKMSELYEVDKEKYLNKPIWELDFDFLPSTKKTRKEYDRIRKFIENYLQNKKEKEFTGEFEKVVHGNVKFIQYRIFPFHTSEGLLFGQINTDVTDKKTALLDLEKRYETRTLDWQKSEAQLHMLVSSVPIAFYSFEKQNREKIWYSDQIEYISGFTAEKLMKEPGLWSARIHREDYAKLGGTFNRLAPNEQISVEYRWNDAREEEIWIFDQAVHIEATEKHPAQIIGCFMDISERKMAELSVLESERNYREIFNSANDAILIINTSSARIEDANSTMMDMFLTKYEKVVNSDFTKFSAGSGDKIKAQLTQKIDQALASKKNQFEWKAKRQDNSEFWVEINLKVIFLNGESRIMAVIKDIDEKKKTEAQLLINEEKYRMLIEGQTDLIIKYDIKERILFASPSYCDLFEIREEEILGKSFSPIIHQKDKKVLDTALQQLHKSPNSSYVELRMQTRQGWRWIAWQNKAILNDQKEVSEILAIGRDITNQKGAEEALRSSEDRFRSIVQRLSDIIIICDEDSYIIYDTPSVTHLLGYEENYLIGQKLLDLIHMEDLPAAREKMTEILKNNNKPQKLEFRIKRAPGRYIPMEGTGINLLHIPAIKGIIITLRDISERKLLDKKILDAVIKTEEQERERFAKNLHDDLGPLLSSVKMYISSLSSARETEKQDYIISQLNEVVKEAITTTKEVSNDLSPHILINYGLSSAIENFVNKIPSHIKVNLNFSLPADRYSNTIENSFYRIIKELINNSLKHADANQLDISLEDTGKELQLSYTDNGKGMDMEKLNVSSNKGMGISNIISRAKSLNGKYHFDTKEGAGFSFIITISIHQPLD